MSRSYSLAHRSDARPRVGSLPPRTHRFAWAHRFSWAHQAAWTACCLLAFASPVTAVAADGWGWSSLNPFGAGETKPTGNQNRRPTTPSRSAAKTPAKQGAVASSWNSVSRGTSNFMGKTKEVLMPWSKPAAKPTSRVPISRNAPTRKPKPKAEQPSWYEFWKEAPEEKTGPKTVNEFLALPRPE
jgi:hypothetical protein